VTSTTTRPPLTHTAAHLIRHIVRTRMPDITRRTTTGEAIWVVTIGALPLNTHATTMNPLTA
jgi:hypothetical protein